MRWTIGSLKFNLCIRDRCICAYYVITYKDEVLSFRFHATQGALNNSFLRIARALATHVEVAIWKTELESSLDYHLTDIQRLESSCVMLKLRRSSIQPCTESALTTLQIITKRENIF